MSDIGLQAVAGIAATAVFVGSTLPMLLKAGRTRDLRSYSLANIALANLGNLLQWLYISSLPLGPIWLLHGFNTGSTALMLVWYLRYSVQCRAVLCFVRNVLARIAHRWQVTMANAGRHGCSAPRAALACSC
jgi:hypothetical protein